MNRQIACSTALLSIVLPFASGCRKSPVPVKPEAITSSSNAAVIAAIDAAEAKNLADVTGPDSARQGIVCLQEMVRDGSVSADIGNTHCERGRFDGKELTVGFVGPYIGPHSSGSGSGKDEFFVLDYNSKAKSLLLATYPAQIDGQNATVYNSYSRNEIAAKAPLRKFLSLEHAMKNFSKIHRHGL